MLVDDVAPRPASEPEDRRASGSAQPPMRVMADLMIARSALVGLSAVDTGRAYFGERAAVDEFLRVNEFDTDNPLDLARLADVQHEAVSYLREVHGYRVPQKIEQPGEIHDLFLLASGSTPGLGRAEQRRLQRYACMTLKVMHIMHHLAGRELVFNLPISEAQLFDRLNAKVLGVIDRLRGAGVPVVEFATGKKSRTSLVSKLLAKRSTLAANIFDAMRFRVVVGGREDILRALVFLGNNLFPFNYVIPDQSQNTLVSAADVAAGYGLPPVFVERFFAEGGDGVERPSGNEFSGSTYRSVNFVVDIPLRLDDFAPASAPAIAFAMAEIQLVDAATDANNDTGENAHALYKKRQRVQIRRRLEGTEPVSEAPEAGGEGNDEAE